MTPQERQLMAQLFDRLATLENAPRDPDAEAMIREGFRRAPNAAYALVQTVLVQDEALKAANAHIQEYEQRDRAPQPQQPRAAARLPRQSMRDSIFGREEPRGSVPRVPQGGAPIGRRRSVGLKAEARMAGSGRPRQGYQQGGYPAGRADAGAPQGGGGARSSAPRRRPRPA